MDRSFLTATAISVALHGALFAALQLSAAAEVAIRKDPVLEVFLVNAREETNRVSSDQVAPVALQGGGEGFLHPQAPGPALPSTAEGHRLAAVELGSATQSKQQARTASDAAASSPLLSAFTSSWAASLQEKRSEAEAFPNAPRPYLGEQTIRYEQLRAEFEERLREMAKRPRKRFFGITVEAHPYAEYLEAWRRKVEQIGTSHFPTDRNGMRLYGSLDLEVAIEASGALVAAEVLRSSGNELLDRAALRIVERAAPFAPFPPEIAAETDILVITRTIRFERGLLTTSSPQELKR